MGRETGIRTKSVWGFKGLCENFDLVLYVTGSLERVVSREYGHANQFL